MVVFHAFKIVQMVPNRAKHQMFDLVELILLKLFRNISHKFLIPGIWLPEI